ncbi:hypothetical protein IJJ05_00095 [Candidatus Saccharibacteria bacterium]|nr:hypothetical protein [Candidatus Saccharibacteria bacterium]
MAGLIMMALVISLHFGLLRFTPPLPAASAVASGVSGSAAASGRLLRRVTSAPGTRTSAWMATPVLRTTSIATAVSQFVVYFVKLSVSSFCL